MKSLPCVNELEELLTHPFPYDSCNIRLKVKHEFDGDEAAAKEALEAYCTESYYQEQLRAHRLAILCAKDALTRYYTQLLES